MSLTTGERKKVKRYNYSILGERIQIDVCKIAPSRYQFTAIDDCTRWKVLGLYSRPTASNSRKFLEKVIEEMPFPIQIIQTDRGREFFAYSHQEILMKWGIKFRPMINGPNAWKRSLLQKRSAMNIIQQMSASDYPILKRI